MKRIALFTIGICLSGAVYSAEPVLSSTSYGKVVFGERIEDVEADLNENVPPMTDPDEKFCRQIEFKAYPGVYFMIEEGRVTRAESSTAIRTSVGYTVGSSLSEIEKHVPGATVESHHYDPDGHYVIVKSEEGKAAILMEEAKGKITDVRGGLIPSVQYVEGCL